MTSLGDLHPTDVLDHVLAFVCVMDARGTILDVNEPALQVSGLHKSELVDMSFTDLPVWAHDAELKQRIELALTDARHGRISRLEATAQFGDGRRLSVDLLLDPVLDDAGGVHYIVASGLDIGERLYAETQREESEERYRTLFNSTDEGFCVIDVLFDEDGSTRDYRFIELNPRFQEQTGLVDAEGKTARELVPNLEQHWFDIYGEVARTGESRRFESGSEEMGRWFDVYAFRIGGAASRRVGILFKDITDRKQAELALEAMNQQLEQRVKERTRQVQDLAAELTLAEAKERARLAQLLHDDLQQQLYALLFALGDAKRAETIDESNGLVQTAEDLARDAIDVSRQTTSNLSPPVLAGDGLTEALKWLASDMRVRYGLDVDVRSPDDLTVPYESIRVLLFQVARELLFNVVKHAEVHEAVATIREVGEVLELSVIDEGEGFDDDMNGDAAAGTGLGLTGIRRRLSLFGGRLDVESQEGRGSRVTITVPITELMKARDGE